MAARDQLLAAAAHEAEGYGRLGIWGRFLQSLDAHMKGRQQNWATSRTRRRRDPAHPRANYYRIELGYPLDIDEIARLTLTDSGGKPQDFAPQSTKATGGVENHEGKHYSLQNWVGYVTPGTGSGPCRQAIIGITD